MRVQRNRSSPSPPRSPLTRSPLGGWRGLKAIAWTLFCCATACNSSSGTVKYTHRQVPGQPIEPVDVQCANIDPPKLIRHVDPEYPEDVRKAKRQGKVEVRGIVGLDGTVSELSVYSSPSETLSKLAVEAAKQWRYTPAHCNGQPIRVYLTAIVRFAL